jgi:phosphoenolpyruvate carboxylase
MSSSSFSEIQRFKNLVGIKFQLYNSLFTSLPFHRVESTGILIPLLLVYCEEGYAKGWSPKEILNDFFNRQSNSLSEEERIDLLFRLVQYIERQVVLFDSLEDASFREIHDMQGSGSMKHLALQVKSQKKETELKKKLEDFSVLLVLTAHPTQFYRDAVLGIINDLSSAVNNNNEHQIYTYLQQLGRTPFYQKQKPTPYDEAMTLVWYLENVFYQAVGRVIGGLKLRYPAAMNQNHSVLKMGFWPGGDRDGNPFVQAETTLRVADALRGAAIKCYYQDVRKLKRRLTFKGVDVALQVLEKQLYENLFISGFECNLNQKQFLASLQSIRDQLVNDHNGLFVELVENMITRVETFGLHFASLDIRQESTIHGLALNEIAEKTDCLPSDYASLPDAEKMKLLVSIEKSANVALLSEPLDVDCLKSVEVIKTIQLRNGEAGCNRYIISQCNSALNVLEVYGLFLLGGWQTEELTVDIVPLFETIGDLENAPAIMETLYTYPAYSAHLKRRNHKQTIMLGFSDGTKDGGYMMANWSIYKAKEALTTLSKQYGFDVLFFDGRGGPPARGGGKTHNFYASLGPKISNKEIQLTIQGQTVSSSFGTLDAAQFNIEQLLHAGISNEVFPQQNEMTESEAALIQEIADVGFDAYKSLKEHPNFADYLLHASPLRFYAATNIGSRPSKRGAGTKLRLQDLRAIPFVGAWSQIKQNVTGYFGVGLAFEQLEKEGRWEEVKAMYDRSLFFRTLMDNSEMAMKKCFFPLTAYLANDPQYGEIWTRIRDEYERTCRYMFRLTGQSTLMGGHPVDQLSIEMRERIVLPLVTIQQYAIGRVNELDQSDSLPELKSSLEKLAMRCSFGIINAGRNSA